MSFNRGEFGTRVTVAKSDKSIKTFVIYYPLCYELINQFDRQSCSESILLGGKMLPTKTSPQ